MRGEEVLSLLRAQNGDYVSGERMSEVLGVSRSAVWKIIKGLREQGYDIHSVTNKGYTLVDHPNLLEKERLERMVAGGEIGSVLHCLDSIDSTNTQAKRLATEGAPHGTVVLAEEQTGGRGRFGRGFLSPKGTGIYVSALLRPDATPTEMSDFTAWVAVAVWRAIKDCCDAPVQIKWTNDLVLGGKKICGILTELGLESESNRLDYMIVGVGVNACQNGFPEDLAEIATSIVMETGEEVDRTELAGGILASFEQLLGDFPQEKEKYLALYRQNCITIGKPVQVFTPATRREGTAI
ncbi:MAG: biotin--[acetyl-CoA-carboxylase] ligase, partial [Eubacteriales bacterium]